MPDNEDDLPHLLRRAAVHDRAAIEVLAARYDAMLHRFVRSRRFLTNEADVKDAIQDTWVNALRNLRTYRGEGAFSTWLIAICTHACFDLQRAAKRRTERLVMLSDTLPALLVGESADWVAEWIAFQEGLAALPPKFRSTFELVKIKDLSPHEAARLQGITCRAVNWRLARAYEMLAEHLG